MSVRLQQGKNTSSLWSVLVVLPELEWYGKNANTQLQSWSLTNAVVLK